MAHCLAARALQRRAPSLIAAAAALACLAAAAQPGAAPALAETRAAVREWNLPAAPLGTTLLRIAEQSGQPISVPPELVRGMDAPAVRGSFGFEQAARAALAGQALDLVRTPNGTLTLRARGGASPAPAGLVGGTSALPQVTVTAAAESESATGPVRGYVARRSATGSKTDTSLLETPQVVNVVTRNQMDEQGVRTVAEALRYTAGVMAEPNGFDVRYDWNYVRGYNTFGTQWLDGLVLPGDPASYAVPRIPAYALERVEVIKGPASVLYGKTVPGGLLNQVSKRPLATAQREVQVSATNFGGAQLAADLTGPLDAEGKWLYRLIAIKREAHTQVDIERDRQTMVAPSLTWRPSADTTLTLHAHYQKDAPLMSPRFYPVLGTLRPNPLFGYIPRSLYLGEPATDSFNREYKSAGYNFEHRFNDSFTVRQNLRYGESSQDMFLVRVHPFNAYRPDGHTFNRVSAISDDDIRSFAVDTQAEVRFATGALSHTLLAGVDHLRGSFSLNFANSAVGVPPLDVLNPVYGQVVTRPGTYTSSSYQKATQTGVYLQDQIRWGRAIATLGLRHDSSDIDTTNRMPRVPTTVTTKDSATTGRVGATYVFDSGIAPYASYSTSFIPTTGVDRLSEPFKAQEGKQFEVGLKYEPPGGWGLATASLFRIDLENSLTPDPVNPQYSVQRGAERVQGLELELKAEPTERLSLLAAYAYTDSKVTRSNTAQTLGRSLLRLPRHQASAWLSYRFAAVPGLQAGIGARYMSGYDTAASYAEDLRIPSVFLWDLGASYDLGMLDDTLKGATLRLNVANVGDKRYLSHCIQAEGSPCNYGARRTVTASLSYKW
jgi:iron complex outermembrane receptor protein